MSKALLKSILPPSTYAGVVRAYRGWQARRAYRRAGKVVTKLVRQHGAEVRGGPFKGMKLRLDAVGSALAPKIVGSYEAEVHRIIEDIVAGGCSRVIDIGCAEGFYAVGLALRLPHAEVWAFDLDPAAHQASAALAALNGVRRPLRFGAECTHAHLSELCAEGAVVICDIEGAELELLDPGRAPGLLQADILVEMHPAAGGARQGDLLKARFASTHACELIASVPRAAGDYPWLGTELTPAETELALCEFRPPMHWGFFRRRR